MQCSADTDINAAYISIAIKVNISTRTRISTSLHTPASPPTREPKNQLFRPMPDSAYCDHCHHIDFLALPDSIFAPLSCPIPSSCDVCPSLPGLDAEILLAHNHLVELLKKRLSFRRFLNERHDPLSRLPTELVSEIFKFYSAYRAIHPWPLYSSPAPLLLGEVCKRWREVTLGTPQLWNTVEIWADADCPYDIDTAAEWLSRSRSLPLSLDILFSMNDVNAVVDTESSTLSPLINLLKSHSARWQNVIIAANFCEPSLLLPLFNNLEMAPTNLEKFEIHIRPDSISDALKYYTQPLLRPKTLKALSGSITVGLPFAWDRLTSLDVSNSLYLEEFLHIIKRAPNLADCSIAGVYGSIFEIEMEHFDDELPEIPDFDPFDRDYPVTSQSLTSLTIENVSPYSADVLDYLNLPSLHTLHYEYPCWSHLEVHSDFDSLLSFLDRSSPTLKDFRLSLKPTEVFSNVDIPYDKFLSLTSIEFRTTGMEDATEREKIKLANKFISFLFKAFKAAAGLQKLQRLVIHVPEGPTPEFWKSLSELVFPKQRAPTPNGSVETSTPDSSNTDLDATDKKTRPNLVKYVEICWRDYAAEDGGPRVCMEPSVFDRLVDVERDGVEILLGDGLSMSPLSKAVNTSP